MEPTKLRDGSEVTIRPIEAGDGDRLREVWDGLSQLSRRRRFLTPSNGEMSDEDLRYLLEVDHRRHEALLALDPAGRCVGVARYVRAPRDRESAELAVAVADDWHRRGVATALLGELTERARANGIAHYTAIVSEDNDVVLDRLERAGARRTGTSGEGETELVLDLPDEGIGDRIAAALRAAAGAQREFIGAGLARLAIWRRDG